MRILLDYRPALHQRTGVGEYVHESAQAIVATAPRDEALVLFSSSWTDRLSPGVVPGATVIDRRIPVRTLNLLWHRLGWPVVERLGAGDIDVAHSAHPLLMPAARAARIVTIHDLDFLDHPERTRGEIRRDYAALAARHASRADRVIVVSRHTAAEVERRLGVAPSEISICAPGAPSWPRRDAEPGTDGVILFLGTLEPRKNLPMLLDAYERLLARRPDAPRLVLAGAATDASADLVARTQRAPLAGRVELPGYVSPDDRLGWYRRALVFVLPSHTEGFGMTALEAMTVGAPVVASARGALPEVVGAAGRLIDPGDAAALAQTLDEILGDAALRQRMSDDGRRQAQAFSWTNTAHRMRDAWALALEHRKRRRG